MIWRDDEDKQRSSKSEASARVMTPVQAGAALKHQIWSMGYDQCWLSVTKPETFHVSHWRQSYEVAACYGSHIANLSQNTPSKTRLSQAAWLPDHPRKDIRIIRSQTGGASELQKKNRPSQFPLLASQFSLLPLIIFRLWQHLAVETGVGSVPQLNLDLPYRGGPTRCAKIGRKV